MLLHSIQQHSKYTIDFIESVYPYEKDIYVGLIQNDIEKKNRIDESVVMGMEPNFGG